MNQDMAVKPYKEVVGYDPDERKMMIHRRKTLSASWAVTTIENKERSSVERKRFPVTWN